MQRADIIDYFARLRGLVLKLLSKSKTAIRRQRTRTPYKTAQARGRDAITFRRTLGKAI
jgi:hypothetical protein